MQVSPYLFFEGNCEQAFAFYAELMNGRITELHRFKDMPAEASVSDDGCGEGVAMDPQAIMHMQLELAGQVLMGSDGASETPQGFALALSLDSLEEAERVFSGLAEGGEVKMPLDATFWAERFALVVDRFAIPWMIMYEGDRAG